MQNERSGMQSMRIVCVEWCIGVSPVVCGSRYGVCAEYMGSGMPEYMQNGM